LCEVRVEIPFNPMAPSTGAIGSGELDDAIEKMAHVALTLLCGCTLATTADMPISLFPIHNQEDPMCQQCLETMSDLESLDFNVRWAVMTKYARYLFNL
jgi:hypothetical protein